MRARRGRAIRVVHSPLSWSADQREAQKQAERKPEKAAEWQQRVRDPGWEGTELGRTQRLDADPVERGWTEPGERCWTDPGELG
jgi:hypothetical protein